MNEGNKHLETLINETRQTLQTEMKYMETSLREAIDYRKEDENLAFQQISNITARINQLEKRVEALETHSG